MDQEETMGQEEEKVARLLADLPEASDDIAAMFLAQGYFGMRIHFRRCPLAVFLMRNGVDRVSVNNQGVYLKNTASAIRHPPGVSEFVYRFDHYEYPQLVREPEVQ
jgi:hypothetical protein